MRTCMLIRLGMGIGLAMIRFTMRIRDRCSLCAGSGIFGAVCIACSGCTGLRIRVVAGMRIAMSITAGSRRDGSTAVLHAHALGDRRCSRRCRAGIGMRRLAAMICAAMICTAMGISGGVAGLGMRIAMATLGGGMRWCLGFLCGRSGFLRRLGRCTDLS